MTARANDMQGARGRCLLRSTNDTGIAAEIPTPLRGPIMIVWGGIPPALTAGSHWPVLWTRMREGPSSSDSSRSQSRVPGAIDASSDPDTVTRSAPSCPVRRPLCWVNVGPVLRTAETPWPDQSVLVPCAGLRPAFHLARSLYRDLECPISRPLQSRVECAASARRSLVPRVTSFTAVQLTALPPFSRCPPPEAASSP